MHKWRHDYFLKDESQIENAFGKRLFILIRRRGFTVKDLANAIGCGPTNVYGYLNGVYKPSIRRMYKMAEVLNCEMSDLLGDSDD